MRAMRSQALAFSSGGEAAKERAVQLDERCAHLVEDACCLGRCAHDLLALVLAVDFARYQAFRFELRERLRDGAAVDAVLGRNRLLVRLAVCEEAHQHELLGEADAPVSHVVLGEGAHLSHDDGNVRHVQR